MKMKSRKAFTVVELLVVTSIIAIMFSIGMISIPKFQAQLKASEEIRRLGLTINSLRNEAIRQRTSVVLSFNTNGYAWDINNNGSSDGSYTFKTGSAWSGSVPPSVTINGLGLTRGIASTQTFAIRNRGTTLSLVLNSNGFITF